MLKISWYFSEIQEEAREIIKMKKIRNELHNKERGIRHEKKLSLIQYMGI